MPVTIEDIEALQAEAGRAENDQRLRAIVAERRVREMEGELAALQAALERVSQDRPPEPDAIPGEDAQEGT